MDLGNKLKIDCSYCRWHSDPPWVRERGKEVAVKNWSFQDVQFHSTGSSMFPYPELMIWGCAHSISNWICKSFKVMDLLYDYVEIMKGCVWVLCMCLEISHEISVLVAFIWSNWLLFWGLCRVFCMHCCLGYNQFCYPPTWFSMSLEFMLSATVIQMHSNWSRYDFFPQQFNYTGSEECLLEYYCYGFSFTAFAWLHGCSPIERFAEEHRDFQGLICLHVICNLHLLMPGRWVCLCVIHNL